MKRIIKIYGDIFHLEDDLLHNEEGPAIEFKNGVEWWMQKGKLHRDNGAAIISKNEILEYWLDGNPATDEEITNIKRNKWIDRTL